MKNFLFLDVGDTILFLKENPGKIYFRILEKYNIISTNLNLEIKNQYFKEAWNEQNKNLPPNNKDRYAHHKNGNRGFWKDLIQSFTKKTDSTSIITEEIFDEIFSIFDDPNTWKLEENFFDLVEFANENKINLGLISNWDLRLRKLLEDLNIAKYFKVILISSEFGFEKPSLKIFEEGINSTKHLSIQNYFYYGDKIDLDYYPPRVLGYKSFLRSKPVEGIETAENLKELISILEKKFLV